MSISYIVIAVVVLAIVVGAVWYEKVYKPKHPTSPVVTTVNAEWAALVARVTALEGKVVAATTPAQAPAAPPGKNGVAGTFSVEVTGNPATDLPAINAHYFS